MAAGRHEKLKFMIAINVSHKTMPISPKVSKSKIIEFFSNKVLVKKKCSIWCAYPKSARFIKKWSTDQLNTLFCTNGGAGCFNTWGWYKVWVKTCLATLTFALPEVWGSNMARHFTTENFQVLSGGSTVIQVDQLVGGQGQPLALGISL